MSSSNSCFLTCIQISQEAGEVVWYSHLFQNFPQFVVSHTVKGFGIVNKAKIDVFLEFFLLFSMIHWMLTIWYLVPLPFLNPAWTSGSSWFMYCWSLAWKILSIVCQYVNRELPDVQAGFRKGRGTRYQIVNIRWIIEKAREFQENICFIDYAKIFDCVDHNKLWKILKGMGIPDHLTCLLRNLYASQEAAVRTRHETIDRFQIGKGVVKAVYCHPAYLTYMQSTSWEMLDWKNTSWSQDCQEKYQ